MLCVTRVQSKALFRTQVLGLIHEKNGCVVSNINLHYIYLYCVEKSKALWRVNKVSQKVLCDGDSVRYLARLSGENLLKYSLTDFVPDLLEELSGSDVPVFLLGETDDVLSIAIERVRSHFALRKLSGLSGFFSSDKSDQVFDEIIRFKTRVLIVGMGMPRQEVWVGQYYERLCAAGIVVIPCGSVIKRLSGSVSTCPSFLVRMSLEWLYRCFQEPLRLIPRYAKEIPFFLFLIKRQLIAKKKLVKVVG